MPRFDFLGSDDTSTDEPREKFDASKFKKQARQFYDTVKLKLHKRDRKAYVIMAIIGLVVLYIIGIITTVIRCLGESVKVGFKKAPTPSLNPLDAFSSLINIQYSIVAVFIVLLVVAAVLFWYIRNKITLGDTSVQTRNGATYQRQTDDASLGSAREMNDSEIVKNFRVVTENELINNNPNTIIYGQLPETNNYLMAKPVGRYEAPNSSMFVCGDGGARKTTNLIIPTLMQLCKAGRNVVATDSSGEVFALTYKMFKDQGYNIRVFNTVDTEHSDSWNFIGSIGTEDATLAKAYAQIIVESTETANAKTDKYFLDGMLSILPAIMLYVNKDENTNTIEQVLNIVSNNSLDEITKMFESIDKSSAAYRQFKIFERSPVKENFLSNAVERLDMFVARNISGICSNEGIDIIKELGSNDMKTIIYIITDKTYAFVSALFLNAATKLLTAHARDKCQGRILPNKVYFVYEEFLTMGYVPNMGDNLSETRKYGLVFILICQAIPQFFRKYGELEAREIMENCKYKLLFGAGGPATAEEFEKYCGDTTVRTANKSSGSPIIKETDMIREGVQQRKLWDYNELMTFKEDRYVLFTTHMHPIELLKPYYKLLPGADEIVEVSYTDYIPRPCDNKIDNTSQPQKDTITDTDNNTEKNDENKSGNNNPSEVAPPKPQHENFFILPLENACDVIPKGTNGEFIFKTDLSDKKEYKGKDYEGKPAFALRYEIPDDVDVYGIIPNNRYMKYFEKVDLQSLTTNARLYKKGYLMNGWTLTRCSGAKIGESRKFSFEGKKPQYNFCMPQCNIVLRPMLRKLLRGEKEHSILDEQLGLRGVVDDYVPAAEVPSNTKSLKPKL